MGPRCPHCNGVLVTHPMAGFLMCNQCRRYYTRDGFVTRIITNNGTVSDLIGVREIAVGAMVGPGADGTAMVANEQSRAVFGVAVANSTPRLREVSAQHMAQAALTTRSGLDSLAVNMGVASSPWGTSGENLRKRDRRIWLLERALLGDDTERNLIKAMIQNPTDKVLLGAYIDYLLARPERHEEAGLWERQLHDETAF